MSSDAATDIWKILESLQQRQIHFIQWPSTGVLDDIAISLRGIPDSNRRRAQSLGRGARSVEVQLTGPEIAGYMNRPHRNLGLLLPHQNESELLAFFGIGTRPKKVIHDIASGFRPGT